MILGPSSPTSLRHHLWGMARRQRDLGRWGSVRFECLEFVPGGPSGFRLAGVIDSFFWRTAPWSSTNPQVSRGFGLDPAVRVLARSCTRWRRSSPPWRVSGSNPLSIASVRRTTILSDMNVSTMTAIREEFEQVAAGTPIPTSRLLRHGPRAAVDQALSRLVRTGLIRRATRGVYYRPRISRLVGPVPPEPEAVVGALAESRGESIAVHGAEAARQLGLSTQTPLSPVFLTSGPSRTFKLGELTMQLKHARPKELALAGTPAGTALRALWYLGPGHVTPRVIAQVRSALPAEEFKALREETGAMPAWLSDTFFHFEHPTKEQSESVESAPKELALV